MRRTPQEVLAFRKAVGEIGRDLILAAGAVEIPDLLEQVRPYSMAAMVAGHGRSTR